MTAATDAPAALERVVLHGPPGTGMETPGDTPPRVPTTGGGDHGTSDTADDTTGDGDHGGGGMADNTTTGTGGGAEVNGAGAPSEDENHGPPAAVRSSTTTVGWQCTEHGRLWSGPLRGLGSASASGDDSSRSCRLAAGGGLRREAISSRRLASRVCISLAVLLATEWPDSLSESLGGSGLAGGCR